MNDMERPDRFEAEENAEKEPGMMSSLGNLWNSLTGKNKEADLSDNERSQSQNELNAMRRKLDSKR